MGQTAHEPPIHGKNRLGPFCVSVAAPIAAPTSGRVENRVCLGFAPEVGTGFHPDLTSRENIYRNGMILGMKKAEINAKFDAIVDFPSVAQFLDAPVKRYSSTMYVRLAFTVAAHFELDIFIVNEVLAVGDVEFQRQCFGKMDGIAHEGRRISLCFP